jgi:hypothetical protein
MNKGNRPVYLRFSRRKIELHEFTIFPRKKMMTTRRSLLRALARRLNDSGLGYSLNQGSCDHCQKLERKQTFAEPKNKP